MEVLHVLHLCRIGDIDTSFSPIRGASYSLNHDKFLIGGNDKLGRAPSYPSRQNRMGVCSDTREHIWLTVPEPARELQIPRTRCYELIQRGELPAVRIGERSIRINRAELERFLLENRRVFGTK